MWDNSERRTTVYIFSNLKGLARYFGRVMTLEVIQEEASEDILRMGSVSGESVSDPVWQTAKHRFIWLLVNLGTAILASYVISLFDATIEQMVALAVLMPIVASMGGNAGRSTA